MATGCEPTTVRFTGLFISMEQSLAEVVLIRSIPTSNITNFWKV